MKKVPKNGQVWAMDAGETPGVIIRAHDHKEALCQPFDGSAPYDFETCDLDGVAVFKAETVAEYYTKGLIEQVAGLHADVHGLAFALKVAQEAKVRLFCEREDLRKVANDQADEIRKLKKSLASRVEMLNASCAELDEQAVIIEALTPYDGAR